MAGRRSWSASSGARRRHNHGRYLQAAIDANTELKAAGLTVGAVDLNITSGNQA